MILFRAFYYQIPILANKLAFAVHSGCSYVSLEFSLARAVFYQLHLLVIQVFPPGLFDGDIFPCQVVHSYHAQYTLVLARTEILVQY